jgi:precorrin-2 dehydrogenase/sirohydrochlorin ferrochelatase
MPLSFISDKIRVLVIGGGRAGFIKAKSFASRGCTVTLLSVDFIEDFKSILNENVHLIQAEYNNDYLTDKHLVVIAVSNEYLIEQIRQDCEAQYKLYLCCNQSNKGLFILPAVGENDQGILTFHTRNGSPATATFIRDKLYTQMQEYNEFIQYACKLRNSLKGNEKRAEIMKFVNTEDFLMFFQNEKHKLILKLFYGGIEFED